MLTRLISRIEYSDSRRNEHTPSAKTNKQTQTRLLRSQRRSRSPLLHSRRFRFPIQRATTAKTHIPPQSRDVFFDELLIGAQSQRQSEPKNQPRCIACSSHPVDVVVHVKWFDPRSCWLILSSSFEFFLFLLNFCESEGN